MKWNEVTRLELQGHRLVLKDAMTMLDPDHDSPEWPCVECGPGEFVLEIHVPTPFHCHRLRVRRVDSNPEPGPSVGMLEVDHAFAAAIDYDRFLAAVAEDPDAYEEWTATELDDELAINFSGKIEFQGQDVVYVRTGDGDGVYPVSALLQGDEVVGLECMFIE